MTRLILLLILKKEISFFPSISQYQSNYHNSTQTSLLKTDQHLTSLETPPPLEIS